MSVQPLTTGMAGELAALHSRAFLEPEAWTASAFEACLTQPANSGFGLIEDKVLKSLILIQNVAEEIEILTLATDPNARRQGHAQRLIFHIENELKPERWLLDVAEDNPGAIRFYEKLGFQIDGRRPRYYNRLEGARVDAILMSKRLGGQTPT